MHRLILDLTPKALYHLIQHPAKQQIFLVWRLLLAGVGGYFCTTTLVSLSANLCQHALGWSLHSSLQGAILLSFLLYTLIILLIISSNKLAKLSLLLLLLTATAALLNHTMQGGAL